MIQPTLIQIENRGLALIAAGTIANRVTRRNPHVMPPNADVFLDIMARVADSKGPRARQEVSYDLLLTSCARNADSRLAIDQATFAVDAARDALLTSSETFFASHGGTSYEDTVEVTDGMPACRHQAIIRFSFRDDMSAPGITSGIVTTMHAGSSTTPEMPAVNLADTALRVYLGERGGTLLRVPGEETVTLSAYFAGAEAGDDLEFIDAGDDVLDSQALATAAGVATADISALGEVRAQIRRGAAIVRDTVHVTINERPTA